MSIYSKQVNTSEIVIFCDEHGNPTGKVGPKLDSHNQNTQRHLAFSLYVFNSKGQFLVTKRAATKKVWPGVWTNSCCGHLALGETTEDAAKRRLKFELDMEAYGYREILQDYSYETPPYNGIIEREFCPVYVAISDEVPAPNPDEVAEYAWVDWQWYLDQTASDSDDYSAPTAENDPKWSWWCKDQLKQLTNNPTFVSFRLKSLGG